ncbi:hypothetical protein BVY04_02005 [bacterium M21]|nr:hypothetical protein BVY04_02005 [bacterium M21]
MALGPKKWLHADVKEKVDVKKKTDGQNGKRKKFSLKGTNLFQRPPNWLWECLVAYIIMAGINLILFPYLPSFRDVDPHPYLLVITLLACRYGSNAGLVSGLSGCILHYTWGATSFEFRVFQDFDSVSRNCVLFLLSGTFLGVLQNRILQKVIDLETNLLKKELALKHQEDQNGVLNAINEELEQKVFTEVQSFSSLREVSESLTHLKISEVCESLPRVICEQLYAEHATVYLKEGEKLILKARHGVTERVRLLRDEITADDSLLGICLDTGKPQCIRDYVSKAKRPQHPRESVMCAPLFDTNGKLLGVVNVEAIPFIKITESSLNLLALIAGLGGKALSTAFSFDAQQARIIDDEELGIFKTNYLMVRLEEEFARSQRTDRAFSLALIGLPPTSDNQDRSSRKEELRMLTDYFRVILRDIGVICLYKEEIQLAILFLDQDSDRVLRLLSRAESELIQLLPEMASRQLTFGVAHFNLACSSWQGLLAQAEKPFEGNSDTFSA